MSGKCGRGGGSGILASEVRGRPGQLETNAGRHDAAARNPGHRDGRHDGRPRSLGQRNNDGVVAERRERARRTRRGSGQHPVAQGSERQKYLIFYTFFSAEKRAVDTVNETFFFKTKLWSKK